MTIIDTIAAVITALLYINVYATTWQDRCLSWIILGSVLAVITALVI